MQRTPVVADELILSQERLLGVAEFSVYLGHECALRAFLSKDPKPAIRYNPVSARLSARFIYGLHVV